MDRKGIAPSIIVAVIVVVAVVAGAGIYVATRGGGGEEGLTPHDPIHITGNADFTAANGVVAGSGTASEPYIIKNWAIIGYSSGDESGHAIWIQDTTAYFIIRNCSLQGATVSRGAMTIYSDGIFLSNVTNGKIENCTCSNSGFAGIEISNSSNNILTNNICDNNDVAISLDGDNNILTNNT
jgi:parallel beta-helix repeat protein